MNSAITLVILSHLLSAPPSQVAVQGSLANGGGAVDGVYTITLSVYPSAVGGTALWSETFAEVPVSDGLFSAVLDGVDADLLDTAATLWLGIKVSSEPELSRTQLLSVPYALVSSRAADLNCSGCVTPEETSFLSGCDAGETIVFDGVEWGCGKAGESYTAGSGLTLSANNQFSLTNGGITGAQIADGTVELADLASGGCADGSVLKRSSGAWACGTDHDTTYAAGQGLSLNTVGGQEQFSLNFGGQGLAGTASHSDHLHDERYLRLTGGSLSGGLFVGENLGVGGTLNLLPQKELNIGLQGAINLTSQAAINVQSGASINLQAGSALNLADGATFNLGTAGSYTAIKQVDNNAPTTYTVSLARYHLSISHASHYRSTKQIPQEIIESHCGDEDGCTVIVAMRNWSNNSNEGTVAAYPFHFFYDPVTLRWRVGNGDGGGGNHGRDNSGTTQHAINAFDACYFTDSAYVNGSNKNDVEKGMHLLYWTDYLNGNQKRCEVTIED